MVRSATLAVLVRQTIPHLNAPMPMLSRIFFFVCVWFILFFLSPFSFPRSFSTICSTNGFSLTFLPSGRCAFRWRFGWRDRGCIFCLCYLGVGKKEVRENDCVNIKSKKGMNSSNNDNNNNNSNNNCNNNCSESQKWSCWCSIYALLFCEQNLLWKGHGGLSVLISNSFRFCLVFFSYWLMLCCFAEWWVLMSSLPPHSPFSVVFLSVLVTKQFFFTFVRLFSATRHYFSFFWFSSTITFYAATIMSTHQSSFLTAPHLLLQPSHSLSAKNKAGTRGQRRDTPTNKST